MVKCFQQGQRSEIDAFHLQKVVNNRLRLLQKKDRNFWNLHQYDPLHSK